MEKKVLTDSRSLAKHKQDELTHKYMGKYIITNLRKTKTKKKS